LIQSASLFGIYAVSFLIVLCNAALAQGLAACKAGVGKKPWLTIAAATVVLVANAAWGITRASAPSTAPTIRIAAVQPVISSALYRSGWRVPENRHWVKNTLASLTADAVASGAQIVFWAEGGNGYLNLRVAGLRDALYRTATRNQLDLIVSSEDQSESGERYNSVFAITGNGRLAGRYDKMQRVPWAESHLAAGGAQRPIPISYGQLGTAICFESTLPTALRRMTDAGAELLFVPSSDAVFKRSALVFAHAQMAVFRAVENGRWLVRAGNTGPSLIVSPTGRITQQTPFYARGILTGEVAMLQAKTFFTRAGHWVPDALALAVLLFAGASVYGWVARQSKGARPHRKPGSAARAHDPATRARAVLARLEAPATLSLMVVAATALSIAASLYFSQRESASPPGYFVAVRDFFSRDVSQADRVNALFLQAQKNTCGAAVLAYVFSYLGRETREAEVLRTVDLSARGLSMLALKNASPEFGFDAEGVQANYPALRAERLPVIAYINDSHYVVVTEVRANAVRLFDPVLGDVEVSRRVFERIWNGYLLLVHTRAIPGDRAGSPPPPKRAVATRHRHEA
jgi:apolipoprotein N-acyltransferase